MKIIIDIKESENLALSYLAGIDCRNRKNYIEQLIRKDIAINWDLLTEANKREIKKLQKED